MGKLLNWSLALALVVGCGGSNAVTPPAADGGNPNIGIDAGVDAGPIDSGTPDAGPADAGPADAGTPDAGPADAGPDGGTITFGTPGPWPLTNEIYGAADGIQESPVVGVTTDEPVTLPGSGGKVTQNLWVATNSALYLLRPGETRFHRYDALDGLHLPGNPVPSCPDSAGTLTPCPSGDAAAPGISEIVGGGPNEVIVGYYGYHDWNLTDAQGNNIDGTEQDPWRHSGKLERVRLQPDGKIQVIRFDMVSSNTVQYWHNRTVFRMIYDHFIHKHELYVGTDHGVDKFSPDLWHPPVGWFNSPDNNGTWMSDHLHPIACYHQWCTGDDNYDTEKMGDWRGLALSPTGDLWVGGRWSAGKILYAASNAEWWKSPRSDGTNAMPMSLGFQYCGTSGQVATWQNGKWVMGPCQPGAGAPPVFQVPMEGDVVSISAVTVTPDGTSWWSSGPVDSNPAYGIASFDGRHFTYFDPMRDAGMAESNVSDMLALPDGRLVLAGPNSGLTIWDPLKHTHVQIHAGQSIPSDQVYRLELDTMVNPPALHVATAGGAAVLRTLP